MLVGQRGQIEDVYPMSDIQLGMVYYSAKNPELAIYHDQIVYELEDDSFNVNLLQKALGLLVSKHEILRTSFHIDEFSVPAQIVWDEVPVRVEEIDISAYSAEEQRVRIRQYLLEDRSQPFDVKSAPLWRMKVFRLRAHQVALAWIFHHAILDGWSVASFISELIDVYFRLKQGPVHVKPLRTKYKDYVVEQMAISEQPEMAAFWQKELQGYKRLQLSVSLSSNQPVTCLIEELDSHLVKELKKVAQANQTTLRALSLAAFLSMLYMISYENDLTVGLVENARPLAEDADRMLGCFLNSVPFRMTIANGMTWKELIQQVHQKQIQMKTYGRFPLMKIVEAIGETRVDENPIFDVLFNYVDFHVLERVKDHSLKISQESYERTNTLLDFSVSATFNHLGIRVTSMLPKEEMRKLLAYYKRALQAFIHHLNEKIDKISLLSEKERHQLLIEFNNTDVDYPRDKTIQQLFEEQVEKTPEQVALIYQGESITYQQLNKMSNQLARALKKKGVQREQIVGIISERSFDMIVGLLGILKAGGAYMPIDPTYPADRIEYMLEDSGIRLLIVQKEEMIPAYYQGEVVLLSDPQWQEESGTNLEIENTASDLAYIIYTSGSTGKPKGILTTHRNVVRTIKNNGYIEITEDDRILQLSNYAFDGSTFDIYSALLNGAQLVLVSKEELLDPRKLAKLIVQYQITVTFMTTALFNTLVHLDVDCFKHMRKILFGGEKVSIKHVQQALAYLGEHKIIHVYGPTETTVFATAFSVDRSILESQTVPIGKPISNTTCYVVNRDGQLQPIGIPGELCIGGEGLARGYLNRPDLTDERFVENPFVPGEWMYKTGDFVRMLPDGNIEYLERLDDQVKIRGFRIELGEITDQLLQHPQIEEAVVVARTDEQGHSYLCAYLVTDGPWTVAELREHLGKSLPEYMIPSYFVELEKLPLNANGKVDKRALPELCADLMSEGYVAPTNATEESLVQIWKDVLKVEQVGIYDSFFELGGHSLKATLLVARIHKELGVEMPLQEVFTRPTVKEMAEYIREAEGNPYATIEPADEQEVYPVSSAQKRMYMVQQLEAGVNSTSYNMPFALEIIGELDKERLRQALVSLIQRHESLRTSFHLAGEQLVQKIDPEVAWELELISCTAEEVKERVTNFIRPFDLSQAPLFRVGLIRIQETHHVLIWDMHHIISDGVSTQILLQELSEQYQGKEAPPLRIQYKDVAVWKQSPEQKERLKKQEAYWLEQFKGEVPVLELPTDYPRPAVRSFAGDLYRFELDQETYVQVKNLSAHEGSTLYMTLLAAYHVLLSKYSGQTDLVVGSPIAGRPHADLESIVGMFVNTLALRIQSQEDQTFRAFLAQVKSQVLQAYENSEYPFEELVEKLDVQRDLSRNPLFDTLFAWQNMESANLNIPGLILRPYEWTWKNAKFDLSWYGMERDTLHFTVEYSTALFKRETIERMTKHFAYILAQVAANPDLLLREIQLVTEEEKVQIFQVFNDTQANYPSEKTIHALFEEQVEKTPDQIAVVCAGESLTYRELNERANQVARVLRKQGAGPKSVVGLLTDRSVEMMIGILGILKSGAAYVPIDPDYPEERILYMLEDSGAKWLLVQKWEMLPASYGGKALLLKEVHGNDEEVSNLGEVSQSHDLAYVIYTSGSTGKPKGVMVEHRSVVRLLINDRNLYHFTDQDVWTQFHSYCFDVSVWEMLGALLYGGKLVIVPKHVARDPKQFRALLKKEKVTVLCQTPSAFTPLSDEEMEHEAKDLSVHSIIFVGEALYPMQLKPWKAKYPHTKFINMYGPTETSIYATYKELTPEDLELNISNIGRPLPTLQAYVLDVNQQLLPVGVIGELYISGDGVARGYLNRPELTAERFVENPFVPGERMYRTGDLARWLPNGEIEYLGRADEQVKIRGFRVELGEIKSKLLEHPQVKEAAVIARKEGHRHASLCAYLVIEGAWTVSEMRQHLAQFLPDHMLPSYFVQLEKLPLTPNGKLDRRALPAPEKVQTGTGYVAPTSKKEKILADIWQEVLKVDRVGIHDNFFELGGDSIKAIQIAARLHQEQLKLNMKDLFKNPTIFELAPYVQVLQDEGEQGVVQGEVPLTPIQHWFFAQDYAEPHHFNQSMMLYRADGWDAQEVEKVFRKLIEHHDALRMRYEWTGEGIVQTNLGLEGEHFTLQVWDLTEESEVVTRIEEKANQLQASLNLSEGPLVRLGLFKTRTGDYLLIVIHHLVVDGVSWRILLSDFNTLYQQEESELPAKSSSYQAWATKLKEYAMSPTFRKKERPYWEAIAKSRVAPLPKDQAADQGTFGDRKTITVSLTEEETQQLLTEAHRAYQTEINDLLLTALVLTMKEWTGETRVAIDLEGHGREEILEGIDLTRTVGWFTSIYPVLFELKTDNLSTAIKEVKETLRRVPNKGVGYGLLQYLSEEKIDFRLQPEMSFNYLGQFGQEGADQEIATLPMGHQISPRNHLTHVLDVNGIVMNNRLYLNFNFNRKAYESETIEQLANRYKQDLLAILSHCLQKEEQEQTPSDFSIKKLTVEELDDIFEAFEEEEIK